MSRLDICLVLVCILSAVNNSAQRSTVDSPDYVAAVVEFSPSLADTAVDTFNLNSDKYVELIKEAAEYELKNADIIVFPEAGLVTLHRQFFTEVPKPSDNVAPCSDASGRFDALKGISCAAQQNAIYVVINLTEMFACPEGGTSDYNEPCPASGVIYYNTNVAFDRNGVVIQTYRKFHLFGEDPVVPPPDADLATFDTDFGVTFGMFTCFDLMFEKPAIQLVTESKVTDLIFPTAWFSELPFLTAVQAQTQWAHSMDVNFLTAGYNEPSGGSGGSGIYAGKNGALAYVMPAVASTHLLVRSVPKKTPTTPTKTPAARSQDIHETKVITTDDGDEKAFFMKQDNLAAYSSQLLTSETTGEVTLCYKEFCCYFTIDGDQTADHAEGENYFYRVLAFDGVRTFSGVTTGGVQICAVVSCANDVLSSCGKTFGDAVAPTNFRSIQVRGTFRKKSAAQFPNTLVEKFNVIPAEDFTFESVENTTSAELVDCKMTLTKETSLFTFGIFGREFTRDGDEETQAGDAATVSALVALVIMGVVTVLIH